MFGISINDIFQDVRIKWGFSENVFGFQISTRINQEFTASLLAITTDQHYNRSEIDDMVIRMDLSSGW
jgi:hypothetical protein